MYERNAMLKFITCYSNNLQQVCLQHLKKLLSSLLLLSFSSVSQSIDKMTKKCQNYRLLSTEIHISRQMSVFPLWWTSSCKSSVMWPLRTVPIKLWNKNIRKTYEAYLLCLYENKIVWIKTHSSRVRFEQSTWSGI